MAPFLIVFNTILISARSAQSLKDVLIFRQGKWRGFFKPSDYSVTFEEKHHLCSLSVINTTKCYERPSEFHGLEPCVDMNSTRRGLPGILYFPYSMQTSCLVRIGTTWEYLGFEIGVEDYRLKALLCLTCAVGYVCYNLWDGMVSQ